jgi:hypothetical protein
MIEMRKEIEKEKEKHRNRKGERDLEEDLLILIERDRRVVRLTALKGRR